MIRMCCVCRKVEKKGSWQLEKVSHTLAVSHVYCPPCYEDLLDEIDRYAGQKLNRAIYTNVCIVQPQEA